MKKLVPDFNYLALACLLLAILSLWMQTRQNTSPEDNITPTVQTNE